MEAVPHHLQQPEIMAYMRAVAGVADVHEVKVWAISSEHIALTAHIKIADMQQWPELLARLQSELRSQFAIQYIVLQPELLAGQPPHHHAAG
jgi:cobalt-zinc-cadmium efflux system protein